MSARTLETPIPNGDAMGAAAGLPDVMDVDILAQEAREAVRMGEMLGSTELARFVKRRALFLLEILERPELFPNGRSAKTATVTVNDVVHQMRNFKKLERLEEALDALVSKNADFASMRGQGAKHPERARLFSAYDALLPAVRATLAAFLSKMPEGSEATAKAASKEINAVLDRREDVLARVDAWPFAFLRKWMAGTDFSQLEKDARALVAPPEEFFGRFSFNRNAIKALRQLRRSAEDCRADVMSVIEIPEVPPRNPADLVWKTSLGSQALDDEVGKVFVQVLNVLEVTQPLASLPEAA